jgi:hypothetical protein
LAKTLEAANVMLALVAFGIVIKEAPPPLPVVVTETLK